MHTSLFHVQRATALFQMGLLHYFAMKDPSGLKTSGCISLLIQNSKELQDRVGYGTSLSTTLCDRSTQNEHNNTTEVRIRTFKVLSPKIHMNRNILRIRQEVMLGQAQGATSGMLGHMTHKGAKALGCIWGTLLQNKALRNTGSHVLRLYLSTVTSLCSSVPRHGSQTQLPLAHRVTRGKL